MKNSLLIWLLILTSTFASAQELSLNRPSFALIDSIELLRSCQKSQNNHTVIGSKDYFKFQQNYLLSQPIVYKKEIKNYKFEISYYLSLPDSNIRIIQYWWEGLGNARKAIDEIHKINYSWICDSLNSKGNYFNETIYSPAKTVWENDFVYIEQITSIGTVNRERILIGWK